MAYKNIDDGELYDPREDTDTDSYDPVGATEPPGVPENAVSVSGCSMSPTRPENSHEQGFVLRVDVNFENDSNTPLYVRWIVRVSGREQAFRTLYVPPEGTSDYLTTPMDSGRESDIYDPGDTVTISAHVTDESLYGF